MTTILWTRLFFHQEERKKSPGEPGTDPDEDEDNPKPGKKDDEEDA